MSICVAPNRSIKLVPLVLALAAACSSTNNNKEDTTNDPSIGAGSGGTPAAPAGTGGSTAIGTGGSTSAGNNTGGGSGGTGTASGGGSGGMSASGGGGGMGSMQGGGTDAGASDASTPDDGGTMEPPCDKTVTPSTDCTAMLAPGDERTCMIGSREYIVYAGKSLNLCQPTALVIDGHGATETAKQQAGEDEFCASGGICWHGLGSGWKAEADQPGAGFIAVFPQGVNNMWADTDADFMVQIVDEVKKVADIDPKKVYISGISNGGALTYWTGCPHADLFHGMAPNAGANNCTSVKQPIPVIAFDDMPDFAYQGSVDAINNMVMLEHCKGAKKEWAKIDSMYEEAVCRSAKEDVNAKLIPCTEVTGGMMEPTTCSVWDQCDGDVQVVFCEVAANTEHGAGNESLDGHIIYENNSMLNTPSVAWRFFKQFW